MTFVKVLKDRVWTPLTRSGSWTSSVQIYNIWRKICLCFSHGCRCVCFSCGLHIPTSCLWYRDFQSRVLVFEVHWWAKRWEDDVLLLWCSPALMSSFFDVLQRWPRESAVGPFSLCSGSLRAQVTRLPFNDRRVFNLALHHLIFVLQIPLTPSPLLSILMPTSVWERYSFGWKSIPRENPLLFCCIMSCPLKVGSLRLWWMFLSSSVFWGVFLSFFLHRQNDKKNKSNCKNLPTIIETWTRIKEVKASRPEDHGRCCGGCVQELVGAFVVVVVFFFLQIKANRCMNNNEYWRV